MRYFKIAILFFIVMLTTGCWNYRELGDLAIVGGIGVDVKGDKFDVSVEVVNVKKVANVATSSTGSSANEAVGVIYEATGHTIKEAMTKIIYECPNELFIGHLKLLAIGEEAAKKGVNNFLDYFTRATESRETFSVVVVQGGKASDMLKITMPIEPVTSYNIEDSLVEIAKDDSTISDRKLDELLMCLYQKGREPTTTAVKITGSIENGEDTDNLKDASPKTSVIVTGSAVFKGDKLIGYLNAKESLAYTIIRDRNKSFNVVFKCDNKGNYGTITVNSSGTEEKTNIEKNKPVGEVIVKGNASLTGFNCNINLKEEKNIRKIEKLANKELRKELDNTIKKVQQEYKSDIFGFGERIYKDHYNYWKKLGKNWNERFSSMKYNIKTNIKITSLSSTINSMKKG